MDIPQQVLNTVKGIERKKVKTAEQKRWKAATLNFWYTQFPSLRKPIK